MKTNPRQRWCFTDWELGSLARFTKCRATDEFIAYPEGQEIIGVIVLRDGTVTNRWEDGTVGVPDKDRQAADSDDEPVKPLPSREPNTRRDITANIWLDVEVRSNGSPRKHWAVRC